LRVLQFPLHVRDRSNPSSDLAILVRNPDHPVAQHSLNFDLYSPHKPPPCAKHCHCKMETVTALLLLLKTKQTANCLNLDMVQGWTVHDNERAWTIWYAHKSTRPTAVLASLSYSGCQCVVPEYLKKSLTRYWPNLAILALCRAAEYAKVGDTELVGFFSKISPSMTPTIPSSSSF
jgi:hypothetical protein